MAKDLTLSGCTFNTSGRYGQSLTGGYASVDNVVPSAATSFSVESSFKTSAVNSAGARVIIGLEGWGWVGVKNSKLVASYANSGGNIDLASASNVNDGAWHTVRVDVSASGTSVYFDGSLLLSDALVPVFNFTGTKQTRVGNLYNSTTYPWSGEIDEVAVWSPQKSAGTYTPGLISNGEANLLALWHFDGDGIDSAGLGATALTLTGPSSGSVGSASTNFTIAANGAIGTSVVVTPSDGGGGGTFAPATVTLTTGSPSGTFTYTPASTGAKTISVTNGGGLTNPSSVTYTASSAAATAVTMTGPTSGVVGSASTSFTVAANGVISGTVVVTPSDSSGGGTFSPTSVSISSGSPTGTFTYTPGSAGAKTISVTNNGGLSNPANITFTASASAASFGVTDAAITWSPYNWDLLNVSDFGVSVATRQTCLSGAYFKTRITGTTQVALSIDTTLLAGFGSSTPYLMWTVGDAPAQFAVLTPGATSLSLATGLTSGSAYTVQVWLMTIQSGNAWGSAGVSPTAGLRITGLSADGGAALSAHPVQYADTAVFFADSIGQGYGAGDTLTNPQACGRSSPWFAGPALGCEWGNVGQGAQGWQSAGLSNVPAFPSAWNYHSAGRTRAFSPAPKHAFVTHGANGLTLSSDLTTWLPLARAAFGPNTWIWIVISPTGLGKNATVSGVNSYVSSSGDAKCKVIDLSAIIPSTGMTRVGSAATYQSLDNLHPRSHIQSAWGAALAAAVLQGMGSGGGETVIVPQPFLLGI